MTKQGALTVLDNVEGQLRELTHSGFGPGGAHVQANDRVQLAISLVRDAYVLICEGEAAQVPSPEQQVRFYRAMQTVQEHARVLSVC